MTDGMVSAVIPVRNGGRFLGQALTSILRQQYSPLEIIVVDDGSSDDTRQVAESFPGPVRYLFHECGKPSAARNVGIAAAQGEFLGFLDADDLWAEGFLRRATEALKADPEAGIAQGLARNWRWSQEGRGFYCSEPYRFTLLSPALFRRSLFDSVGLLDPTLRFGEDSDYYLRCWEQCVRKLRIEAITLLYRRHEDNMTANKSLTQLGVVQVYKRRLDRIRLGQVDLSRPREEGLKEYLGDPTLAYDDGGEEEVGEEVSAYFRTGAPHRA